MNEPTLNDVWRLFQESDRQHREMYHQFKETADRLMQELFEMGRETDRKFQETDRKFQETDQQIKETDRQLKEQIKEISLLVKDVAKQVGNLGNRLGEFVEELVLPSALRLFQERGIDVQEIYPRARAKRKTGGTEIDLLLINTTHGVAIEVKSSLSLPHIETHVERLNRFRSLFPHHANLIIHGAVAAMVIPEEVVNVAIQHGLFVMVPAADTMQLLNGANFQPRVW